jgi:hypothetical protein
VLEVQFNTAVVYHFLELYGIFFDAKNYTPGVSEFYLYIFKNPFLTPEIGSEVHDLLRSAPAFYGRTRASKDRRVTWLYVLQTFIGVGCHIKRIVARYPVFAKSFG